MGSLDKHDLVLCLCP